MLVCPKHIQIFLESADWRTGAKTTEVETRVATCVWFASTGTLLTGSTKLTVEVTLDKGQA